MLNLQQEIWLHSLHHHRTVEYLRLAVCSLSHLDTVVADLLLLLHFLLQDSPVFQIIVILHPRWLQQEEKLSSIFLGILQIKIQ